MPRAQAGERLVPGFTRHTRSSPFARSNLPRPTHVRAAPKSLLNPAGAPLKAGLSIFPLLVCTVTTERREKHMHTSSVRLPPDLPIAASRSRSRGHARSQAVKATTIVSSAWRLRSWRGPAWPLPPARKASREKREAQRPHALLLPLSLGARQAPALPGHAPVSAAAPPDGSALQPSLGALVPPVPGALLWPAFVPALTVLANSFQQVKRAKR